MEEVLLRNRRLTSLDKKANKLFKKYESAEKLAEKRMERRRMRMENAESKAVLARVDMSTMAEEKEKAARMHKKLKEFFEVETKN